MNAAAEALGERLRAARAAQGLSAQQVADRMHLDAWVIEALENADYVRIGPPVYVKGHLKRYAGDLGLPAAEIIDAYDTRSAVTPVPAELQTVMPVPAAMAADRPPLRAAVLCLAAAAVIVVIAYRWQHREPTASATDFTTAAATESTAASRAATDDDGKAATAASTTIVASGTAAPGAFAREAAALEAATEAGGAEPTLGAGYARLRLSFSANSWVDVHDAEGRRLYSGNGLANSVKTIAGDAPMKVYLGFANGVQLQVNSRAVAIGRQFVAGDVARFEAGADGVLRRAPPAIAAGEPHTRG